MISAANAWLTRSRAAEQVVGKLSAWLNLDSNVDTVRAKGELVTPCVRYFFLT